MCRVVLPQLEVIDSEDIKSGFKLQLTFSPDNPAFSATTLAKTFHYKDNDGVEIKPATIDWVDSFVSRAQLLRPCLRPPVSASPVPATRHKRVCLPSRR